MAEILGSKNVCKYHGSLAVNKDTNLGIKRGTAHAVMGENGARKSTFMNIVVEVNQLTSGEIFLNSKKVSFQDANDADRTGTGMVQQESTLLGKPSVLDNIIMGYEDAKRGFLINKKEGFEKIRSIRGEYGFHSDLDISVCDLSVAVQQQVKTVKVLSRKADIIILNEPTAVPPYQEIRELFRAIRYLTSQGKTVIFIAHKLKEVSEISDTIAVMKGRVISGEISAEEATKLTLTNMMVGRDAVLKLGKQPGHLEKEVLSVGSLVVRDDRKTARAKDTSLRLREGETLGIVRVLSNGQDELMEAITGMRGYEAETICPHGEKPSAGTLWNNYLEYIGYVLQDRISVGSSMDSSLVENCIMGYHLNHLKKEGNLMDYRGAESFTDSIIEEYNVKTRPSKDRAGSLSNGNLQRLIVEREFSQNHKALLVEDPMRGIDIGSIEFIWEEIQEQVEKEDIPVVLITYDLAGAMILSDRILIMYDRHINRGLTDPDYDKKGTGIYMMGSGNDER